MTVDKEKLGAYVPKILRDSTCGQAAVLIPLIETENGYEVLFEVRSSKISEQPGDICFPGGSMDPGEDAVTAAVREAGEELYIKPEDIEILGKSDFFHNFGVVIYPVCGIVRNYDGNFSEDEVEEVFTVPLEYFMNRDPEFYKIEWKVSPDGDFPYYLANGGRNYKWRKMIQEHPFYYWKDRIIWGITARMLYGFVQILKENDILQ